MKIDRFPQKVKEQLKYYVYLYTDPRFDRTFYLGQGKGNRIFSHLKDTSDTEKVKVLNELNRLGISPTLEVLKYGLTKEEALLVESTAIDLLKLGNLTNVVHGHDANFNGRTNVEDLVSILSCEEARIKEPSILITINRAYRFGMSVQELYDATRSAWVVNPSAREPKYAMAVFLGIIREVYLISAWLPGGSTMRVTDKDGIHEDIPNRWEFVGKVAELPFRKKYVGKSVRKYQLKGAQNPIKYLNCPATPNPPISTTKNRSKHGSN